MNTLDTAGLGTGKQVFKAILMPCGINAGAKGQNLASRPMNITVEQNPDTALSIIRQNTGTRIVKAGDKLEFKADYAPPGTDAGKIDVSEQKKTSGTYSDITEWEVTGNTVLTGGTAAIEVTVPQGIEAGTYRILFTLGEQQVPYNVIVE